MEELGPGAKQNKECATALFSVGVCLGLGGMSGVTQHAGPH